MSRSDPYRHMDTHGRGEPYPKSTIAPRSLHSPVHSADSPVCHQRVSASGPDQKQKTPALVAKGRRRQGTTSGVYVRVVVCVVVSFLDALPCQPPIGISGCDSSLLLDLGNRFAGRGFRGSSRHGVDHQVGIHPPHQSATGLEEAVILFLLPGGASPSIRHAGPARRSSRSSLRC